MKSQDMGNQGMSWTKDDVRILKQYFRNNSNAEVANMLGRSSKSIERKAAKLGLVKTKKYLRQIGRKI